MNDIDMKITAKDHSIELSDYRWTWQLGGENGLIVSSVEAPCLFYRLMQHLILGIIWKRIEK